MSLFFCGLFAGNAVEWQMNMNVEADYGFAAKI
jgi:hypothetical protein